MKTTEEFTVDHNILMYTPKMFFSELYLEKDKIIEEHKTILNNPEKLIYKGDYIYSYDHNNNILRCPVLSRVDKKQCQKFFVTYTPNHLRNSILRDLFDSKYNLKHFSKLIIFKLYYYYFFKTSDIKNLISSVACELEELVMTINKKYDGLYAKENKDALIDILNYRHTSELLQLEPVKKTLNFRKF